MSQKLEVWKRVGENGIGRSAVRPQGLMVRGYRDAVADALAPGSETFGFVGELDPVHLFVRRKIYDRESVRFR